jgi:hypothetical protein
MLEESYQHDLTKTIEDWNKDEQDFKESIKRSEDALKDRQNKEIQDMKSGLDIQYSKDPKFSSTYLK